MNKRFTEEQIEAYASAIEAGDAVWCGSGWWEVTKEGKFLETASSNRYVIRNYYGTVATEGFFSGDNRYRVTTLEYYKLQGGEKIVWLGEEETMVAQLTFGKIYNTFRLHSGEVFYHDDNKERYEAESEYWGVIPTYEQVVSQVPKTPQEDSTLTVLEQKLMELRKEHSELQKDILEKQGYERKLVEVVINLEEAIDSLKKIGEG